MPLHERTICQSATSASSLLRAVQSYTPVAGCWCPVAAAYGWRKQKNSNAPRAAGVDLRKQWKCVLNQQKLQQRA
jgi:hypothetical protein